MKETSKRERKEQIEAAAYAVLRDKGFKGASMLAIAKAAGASNETMYRWYGNKAELFASLVRSNTAEIEAMLRDAIKRDSDALDSLARLGPTLLQMVTSERAVTLNRAAAADFYATKTLGKVIAEEGRGRVAPLFGKVFGKAIAQGHVNGPAAEIAEVYLRQLIGDAQIRRCIGVMPELTTEQAEVKAQFALATIIKLYSD